MFMCFCERQAKAGSSGQGDQETIHGHATRRYQRYEMRAAQGVGGVVNYFRTSLCSRMTAQETSSTEDTTAADTGVG